MAEFTVPADAEFAAITRRTARRMARQLLAVSAHYDEAGGRVMIMLTNGTVVGFPAGTCMGFYLSSRISRVQSPGVALRSPVRRGRGRRSSAAHPLWGC